MDFFAAQDHARKQTKKLVVYFILAVVGIIAAIYAVCVFLFSLDIPIDELTGSSNSSSYSSSDSRYNSTGQRYAVRDSVSQRTGTPAADAPQGRAVTQGRQVAVDEVSLRWWNPQLLATVSGAVLLVILGASAFKTLQLRGGGGVVARSLGGRQIDPGTRDPAERRLMNVVEEMALASGTPVPEVYVLDDEQGINAFASGHSPHDAAIGVTRGCMETLNRDELQGVIAHEFSHILNGDMRLNVRLIGILFGILVLAVLGEMLMRSALWSGGARRNNKDNSAMVFLVLGLAVMAIGYIGVLFGRLIQSAISRQREYLADASAVQFTRYPDGIANALIKIGAGGSKLASAHAQETAHMFFANGLSHNLGGSFATHPPLHARIRAIKADWDGKFVEKGKERPLYQETPRHRDNNGSRSNPAAPVTGASGSTVLPAASAFGAMAAMGGGKRSMRADAALAAIGTLATQQIEHAQGLHTQVREILGGAGSDPQAAKALIYALMLGEDDAAQLPAHLDWIKAEVEPEIFPKIQSFAEKLAGQDALHLPLLELAMPALAKLEKPQLKAFGQQLERLAARDERLTFGELAIVALVRRKIARKVATSAGAESVIADAAQLADAFSVVLTAVLRADTGGSNSAATGRANDAVTLDAAAEQQAFEAAVARAPLFAGLVSLRKEAGNETFLPALERLSGAAFALKKQMLAAAAEAVLHDGHVSTREAEWLRLIAACLDCPMPPAS